MNCCCTNSTIMKLSTNHWSYIIHKEKRCFLNTLIKISCNFVHITMCDTCIYWFSSFLYTLHSKFLPIYSKHKVNRKWALTWWLPLLDVLLFCWFFSRRAETLCSRVSRVWSCGSPPLKHTRKLLSESFTTWRSSTLPYKKNITS